LWCCELADAAPCEWPLRDWQRNRHSVEASRTIPERRPALGISTATASPLSCSATGAVIGVADGQCDAVGGCGARLSTRHLEVLASISILHVSPLKSKLKPFTPRPEGPHPMTAAHERIKCASHNATTTALAYLHGGRQLAKWISIIRVGILRPNSGKKRKFWA